MEKIKDFIRLNEETKLIRQRLANQLIESTFITCDMDKAADLISQMKERAKKAGVIAIRKENGKNLVQVEYENFIEVTKEEERIAGTVYEEIDHAIKHYSALIEEIELVTVDFVWKKNKNASA